MAVSKAVKEKSLLVICSSFAAAILSVAAVWTLLDASVLTEAEHKVAPHATLTELITKGDLKSFCYLLDDRIDRKEARIYDLKKLEADKDYIHMEEKALVKLRRQFDSNNCVKVVNAV